MKTFCILQHCGLSSLFLILLRILWDVTSGKDRSLTPRRTHKLIHNSFWTCWSDRYIGFFSKCFSSEFWNTNAWNLCCFFFFSFGQFHHNHRQIPTLSVRSLLWLVCFYCIFLFDWIENTYVAKIVFLFTWPSLQWSSVCCCLWCVSWLCDTEGNTTKKVWHPGIREKTKSSWKKKADQVMTL